MEIVAEPQSTVVLSSVLSLDSCDGEDSFVSEEGGRESGGTSEVYYWGHLLDM